MWTIYYSDGSTVTGHSESDWLAAPNTQVQVVVEWRVPGITERPWRGVIDRFLWTGEDRYDPFGWGVKFGELIPDADYQRIWEQAAYRGKCNS